MNIDRDAASILAEGMRLHQSGRRDEARARYEEVLSREPGHPDASHLLGLCAHQDGRSGEALRMLQVAIDRNPAEPAYFNSLGLALKAAGRLDEAASAFERAIALNGSVAEFHNNLGSLRLQQKQLDQASASIRNALTLRPHHVSAHNNLGLLHLEQGRHEEAIACFRQAVHLEPAYSQGWANLGSMLRRRQDWRGAADAYGAALKTNPGDTDHLIALAESLLELGQRQAAIDAIQQALRVRPDLESARYFLAALGAGPVPTTAPRDYVAQLFDRYAQHFDEHLQRALSYRAPELLDAALRRVLSSRKEMSVLDAGCGTGICGRFLHPIASRLVGVDLSPEMLKRAAQTGHYDELIVGDLVQFMVERAGQFDLIVAADVFGYLGGLGDAMRAAATAIRPAGLIAFTAERSQGEGYTLSQTRRYAHSPAYLRKLAETSGFRVLIEESAILRREAGSEVAGIVMVLQSIRE